MMVAERTELEELAGLYSDLYKDVNGFRPRTDISHWTVEKFDEVIGKLVRQLKRNAVLEREAENEAASQVEQTIANLISIGAKDRTQAIRWLADAEGAGEDMEYLCFNLGLPYGYFNPSS